MDRKRWSAFFLALVLLFSVTACGGTEKKESSESASAASTQESSEKTESTEESKSEEATTSTDTQTGTVDAKEEYADVVVIGAGGAGMSAAIAAKDAGASVVVLEKEAIAGGNTSRATGGMNASETKFQEAKGIKDTNDLFYEETMKGGKGKNDPALLRYMVDHSASAIDWLDGLGIHLENVTFSGGFSVERIHRPKDGSAVGSYMVEHFVKLLEERGVPILYKTKAVELIKEGDAIVGVKAENADGTVIYKAKAVVVATGGFGGNLDMVAKIRPELKGFVTTNAPGITGDGINMVEAVGGAVVDMDQIQIHPTVEQKTSDLITEALRGEGAILVNGKGNRFVNELLTRDVVSKAELEQDGGIVYILFDQKVRDNNKAVEKYIKRGYTLEASTIEELAAKMDVDATALKGTIDQYNAFVAAGKDEEFGRETGLHAIDTPDYYAIRIAPGVHHTMGGVKIDTATEVLNAEGKAIPGLYAAGEVTGGIHGANRIGGNAVCDIVVFGREAGEKAAAYAKANGGTGETTAVPAAASDEVKPNEGVAAQFKDGVYTETVKGHNADLVVEVTVKDGFITSITFPSNGETPAIFKGVETTLVPEIIKTQSVKVDTVSGATVSSTAVIDAVQKIMDANKK